MDWLQNLLFGTGIAHCILVFAVVITAGVILGRLKIGGISLGITWILFVGIVASHSGMLVQPEILNFVKEFGLVLFVYSIGLQVGPSFFSSFKRLGMRMNSLAIIAVALTIITTFAIHRFRVCVRSLPYQCLAPLFSVFTYF